MTTNNAKREEMLRKIQALRQTTIARGATDGEAQNAVLLAQKLMSKYHIEEQEVQFARSPEAPVGRNSTGYKAMAQWSLSLLHLIANNFRCKPFLSDHCASFLGEETDIKLATEIYRMVYDVADRGSKKIRRQYRKEGKSTEGVADSYLRGFILGLDLALQEQKKTEDQSFALVLVTPESVIKAYDQMVKDSAGTVYGRKLKHATDASAYHQGNLAGQNSLKKQLAK